MSELWKVAHHEWNVNDMDYVPCAMGKIPYRSFMEHFMCVLLLT